MTNVPSVSRRIIYDVFGRPVENWKQKYYKDDLNDLYTKLSKEYDENHKWNSL